ncbi:probable receptor-like protein kinase At1g49730 [Rutidosis leptorrhynchoides]|uniref:probable receptor-like protein kinase At1g49730 n=1 Tax=Rutidosis leptorrhynchoides TaxID=125765 RepID=UPI003A9A5816
MGLHSGIDIKSTKNLLIGGAIILVILFTIILKKWAVYLDSKAKARSLAKAQGDHDQKSIGLCSLSTTKSIRTYALEEIKMATRDFRIRIGVGATSYVYLAELGDGQFGAVKRVMEERGGYQKMFLDEVSILLRISHPNLVALLGFCLDKGEQLLLLEYIPNKSLFDRLHTNKGKLSGTLSWSSRLSIALDIAYALDYLHSVADPPVIHRDVKSSNVLLINDDHAKLADFGLCKLGHESYSAQTPTIIRGSLGYVDTNYLNTGLVSPKSDVYSFGVLLLELITGMKSLQGSVTLAEWTNECRKHQDVDVMMGMLDPKLNGQVNVEQLRVVVYVVNLALLENSMARPNMAEIASRLSSCMDHSPETDLPV